MGLWFALAIARLFAHLASRTPLYRHNVAAFHRRALPPAHHSRVNMQRGVDALDNQHPCCTLAASGENKLNASARCGSASHLLSLAGVRLLATVNVVA